MGPPIRPPRRKRPRERNVLVQVPEGLVNSLAGAAGENNPAGSRPRVWPSARSTPERVVGPPPCLFVARVDVRYPEPIWLSSASTAMGGQPKAACPSLGFFSEAAISRCTMQSSARHDRRVWFLRKVLLSATFSLVASLPHGAFVAAYGRQPLRTNSPTARWPAFSGAPRRAGGTACRPNPVLCRNPEASDSGPATGALPSIDALRKAIRQTQAALRSPGGFFFAQWSASSPPSVFVWHLEQGCDREGTPVCHPNHSCSLTMPTARGSLHTDTPSPERAASLPKRCMISSMRPSLVARPACATEAHCRPASR